MFGNANNNSGEYFAKLPAEKLAGIALGKAESFYNLLRTNAYLEKLNKMWRAYHGAYNNYISYGHQVSFTGEQGELVQLPVNHFRNIAEHIYNMITSNRPVMDARAINTDYKSKAQTILANGVLDYYMREKNLEDALKRACKMAIVQGAGYIKMEWNATAGEAYDVDPDTGEINYEGEAEFSVLSPLDVVMDGTKETWDNDWLLVRTFHNRFNLMAKYPELADKIKAIPPKSMSSVYRLAVFSNDDTDDIAVYEFYHKRTEALPDGRYVLFVDADVVLLDTKMPYRSIPIFRIVPSEIMGTPYGYTPMFDIFPIQEAINSLYSTIMTNQNAFGVQNLWVPRGADVEMNSLDGAMNIISGNIKPEALQLTETPQEVFKFLEMLINAAETISGVSSVTRGNPEASLESGAALALVQSMSLQFISGLQQSYVKLIEDVGTALIQMLKDFATTPKVIALVGKNNRPYLKEFVGDDINAINRVVVDVGNPLSKTIAGRVQMADQMMQMQLLKNPAQYFEVLSTGRLDSAYEGQMHEILLVTSENEKLLEGEVPLVTALDQHSLHIQEHKSVLADPDLRQNPQLVQNTLEHIQQHIDLLRNTDPDLLALIGEQPLTPPQQLAMGGPINMPQPPQGENPTADIMQQQAGQVSPPETVANGKQIAQLPKIPVPPKPFENLPTNPQDMVPGA